MGLVGLVDRVHREFSVPGILMRITLTFFFAQTWEMIVYFLISLNKILKISLSSRKMRFSFKFLNKRRCIILRKIKKLKVFFGKYQSRHKQQIKFSWILARIVLISILVLVSKSEIEDNKSRSRLDAWDWNDIFLGLVSKPEIKCHKFSSRLDVRDWIREILILVSRLKKCFTLCPGAKPSVYIDLSFLVGFLPSIKSAKMSHPSSDKQNI